MPKQVFIESRNQTLEFPDDATQEEINQVIAAEFPRTGEDVAYDMSKMGSAADIRDFIAAIPDEDYVKLNNYRADKKLSWGELAGISGEAIGTIVGDVVKGVKSAVTEAGEGVIESAARGVGAGTVDLVNLAQKLVKPSDRIPELSEFVGKPITRLVDAPQQPGAGFMAFALPSEEEGLTNESDYRDLINRERLKELESLDLAEASENLIKGAPVEEVARGASYLDAVTLGGLAKNIAKSGVKTIFKKTAQAPISTAVGTAPSVLPTAAAATIETGESFIPAAMRQNAEAFAAKVGEGAKKAGLTGVQLGAGTVKGAADLGKAVIDTAGKLGLGEIGVRGGIGAAIGYQEGGSEGAIVGGIVGTVAPKVARAGLAGVSRTADFIGAAAKVAKQGPRRTGLFENMAQATNISPEARRVAEKVLFTQPFFQYASEAVRQAAQRALIGAPIGAAIGYATDGEEGAAAGFGAGVGISAIGGPLDASIDAAKTIAGRSTARSQRNAMGDIKSFVNDITDDKARSDYAEVMDQAIRVAGPERAADMLDNLRLAEAMGANVQVVPPSQRKNVFNSFSYDGTNGGTITINPDRMTQGTVSHEVFHQLFNVGVKAELQKALRETYLPTRDADGNIVKPGLYDDTEFAKKAAQLAERYKNNPEGYRVALEAQSVLENPAGYSEAALDNARSFVIDEMTAEYSEAFMGRSRPGVFNPDRLPLWHRRLLQQIDDRILNTINDKLYANRNVKDPTVAFTDEQGKPVRVPQLDKVLKRAFANKMSREKGQVAGKTQKAQEVVIPNKPRDLLVFANATFGATRDVLGTDENGNPRILTPQEQKAVTAADFDEAKAMYQTLPDTEKQTVRVTNKVGEAVDINQSGARIQITSQTPESVFEKFLAVAKSRGMGNQQLANMRQLFASMVANEGPTFNTVNNPVYEFDKRTGTMKAKVRPPTRQEIYPTAITVNSAGGFNVEYIDISRVKANAQKILQNPQFKGVWTDLNGFMADFGRSMRNLSTENPIPSAELLGNGNAKIGATKRDLIAEAMNVTLPKRLAGKGYVNEPTIDPLTLANKERRVGGSAFRDFRIERLTEVSPTTERLKMVKENAYENIVRRYQPDAFTRETLPNGEAMTNPDGYRILKKTGSSLFRVYDDKGELIGVAKNELGAMRMAQRKFIDGWHGSPHNFMRFMTQKIGTGEGVQAFGYGLYFGESKKTGVSYKNALGRATINGQDARKWLSQQPQSLFEFAKQQGLSAPEAAEAFAATLPKIAAVDSYLTYGDNAEMMLKKPEDKAELKRLLDSGEMVSEGNLYRVQLNVLPEQLLDWDKPLSEQSEKVRDAFRKWLGNDTEAFDAIQTQTGGEWYGQWENQSRAKFKSEMLASMGIPGIRYLDGGSRFTGEGTHNYVIFDDGLIRILDRNGKPVGKRLFRDVAEEGYNVRFQPDDTAKETAKEDSNIRFQPSSLTARDINTIADEVGGGEVKGGAKKFGAFMREMRDKGITLRDVVKSYGITVSSINRKQIPAQSIKKAWPDAPFKDGEDVRPEDAFATLLGTKEGQEYLNSAERGEFNEPAADAMMQKFRPFGLHNTLKKYLKNAAEEFFPKAQSIIDAVNNMPTEQFADFIPKNIKGVKHGKVGFFAGHLGRGDLPTFDSRMGNLVYGERVKVTKKVLMDQRDRLTQLGITVPDEYKDFAQTLLHHEVWDRLNNSDTEHAPIKESMLRFQPDDPNNTADAKAAQNTLKTTYFKNQEEFQKAVAEGRVRKANIEDFIGKVVALHQPDNAMVGTVEFNGTTVVVGEGGVYYAVKFGKDGSIWASTQHQSNKTAKALNEIHDANNGKIYMGLTSAPVTKLFSSTNMATGIVDTLAEVSKLSKEYGMTESALNGIITKASKVPFVKKKNGKIVSESRLKVNLDEKNSLNENLSLLREVLKPENSSFDNRTTFSGAIANNLAVFFKDKPKESAKFASLILGDSNKYAKASIRKGKLSKDAILQAFGDMFSEGFLKDFQSAKGSGHLYAVLEMDGRVESVHSPNHKSYPFTVKSTSGKKPVVHILDKAMPWQDVVGLAGQEGYVPKELKKSVYPSSGFSTTKHGHLEVKKPREGAVPTLTNIMFQPDPASPNILNGSNGTRIIKSPSGKFRVYSVTGTLLGIRDTEQAAKKLATK